MTIWIRVFAARLRGLFGRRQTGHELEDEIQLHIQMLTDRFILQGMEPDDARAAARRQFGNATVLREHHNEQRSFPTFVTLWRDLHFGRRQLQRNPLFAFVAITSVALGIGANTAIFTAAKRVLFDTLPVASPAQLRMLTWVSGQEQPVPPVWGDVGPNAAGGLTGNGFSYPVLEQMRKRTDAVQALIAFKDAPMAVTIDGHSEMIHGELISGDGFQSLGVRAGLGRTLTAADDLAPGSGPVAVISDGYWAQRFARSPLALGKAISLNGVPITIVGVTGGRFAGLQMGSAVQMFVPLAMQPLILPRPQNGSVSLLDNPQSWWVQILVRLRPEISDARAQGELDATLRRAAMPVLKRTGDLDRFHLQLEPGERGLDYLREEYARPSYVLLALAGLVLLLACLNLANLLLARSATRQRELSTRLALGASRASIVRQMLTESVLLSSLGGAAGLLLGYLGRNIIPRLLTNSSQPEPVQVQFDWHVLLFTMGISFGTGILFGLAPAWQATRTSAHVGLRDSGGATASRHQLWFDKSLVIGQIALSAILLMGAGLFVHTLLNLNRISLGFETDHLLLFRLSLPRARYSDAQMTTFFRQLQEKLASLPGVRLVTVSSIGIIGDGNSGSIFHVLGRPQETNPARVQTIGVGVDFFQTLEIPILQGRAFNHHDSAASPKVAIVNHALARKFFPNENPIGKTFEVDPEDIDGPIQIVGIAADTRYADLREQTPPVFFVPYVQNVNGPGHMVVELSTFADPTSVLPEVRGAIESLDQAVPMVDVRTMKDKVRSTMADERALAQLASEFSALALVLASIGIYGMMAYQVNRRTGEIGLRIALGAQTGQVLTGVLREAFWLSSAGIVVGTIAALWLKQFIQLMLYGLGNTDVLTVGGTALLLLSVSLIAAFAPARRASRIDPIRALRQD
jgi:predicted permease